MSRTESQAVQIARLEQQVISQNVEIADLKAAHAESLRSLSDAIRALEESIRPLVAQTGQLTKLISEAEQQRGMVWLARQLIAWGGLAGLGAALYGMFHFFARGGQA